jgi:ferric-dicitrate binding protein FerR (iron transport regulator)
MSDSSHENADERAAEQALRNGLRAKALSAEAIQRIRAATRQEWQAAYGPDAARVSVRRQRVSLAAAAAMMALAVAIGWSAFLANSSGEGIILGKVSRFEPPGIVETRFLRGDRLLNTGAPLLTGQSLEIRGDSLVTLTGGGNLRVARASAIELAAENSVRLERGELYVDIPPGAHASDHFMVVTPAGEFRHVGTQFAVAVVNGATRLRVREGSVRWHASAGDSTVGAGTEVLIGTNHQVTRRPIGTVGREWAWAEAMAPDIEIENRPLQEFLEWFSRETGRKLVMSDDAASKQAATIRMHGEVRGLTAVEALSAVMAATTLRFELPEGAIRISSTGDATPPPT